MALGLAYDTETSGVPNKRAPLSSDSQPEVIQLAAILFDDETGEIHGSIDLLIKPTSALSAESVRIHGFTEEHLSKYGIARRSALSIFHGMLKIADFTLAHNHQFDQTLMHIMYLRENISTEELLKKTSKCTMLMTTDLMKLPNVKYPNLGYKWPSLDEAYREYVDPNGFENAHNALADIKACIGVYMKVKDLVK